MESLQSPASEPLAGFTIGVTAARRSEELITLLERRGATAVHAPAIRIIPLVDDIELRRVTTLLVETPPDVVIVTTGIGFRGWIEAAHGWDVADDLVAALASTRILARGPKACGAIRQAGLREEWSPASEASQEVLDRLLADGAAGLRIAVQLHGAASEWEPNADICGPLTLAGAQVIKVPVYRWEPPEDSRRMNQLIAMIIGGEVDAVSFTSAPAVASMLQSAKVLGSVADLVAALRADVAAMCVGPVTSAPLRQLGVPTMHPDRYRLGALARLIADEVPRRARHLTAGGHHISVRSATVAVDGDVRTVPPSAMAMLRRLMANPGRVVSRAELLAQLPGGGADPHAVDTAMTRLRSALGAPCAVQTVIKRGYRLAMEPAEFSSTRDGFAGRDEARADVLAGSIP
ncbi:uroporphyrinogen-III synthase [Mycobacterium lacus]|uniref:Putative transcriptional regulatory protein n=1 Tax=Mycobacterium lacus TaxID=169765 RepID=A0A1X1XV33_9MYCO|nr:uroporphyrinogen-III synthase [Mycobacterium lacus]MCV7123509.1 uroporphyrinogen-III synthase [Mycobacterium lacus]ORW02697.1 bifunctional uroporphyrinogen-III synthetase/response regulator domain protein [Mycobacterium lacus]BBX95499.1 putative transcriptional regulatory protein [Mycobacterium lacus]